VCTCAERNLWNDPPFKESDASGRLLGAGGDPKTVPDAPAPRPSLLRAFSRRMRKRPANRAFRISLARENVCPLTGKLRSTNENGYGSFQS
jgi:hypothetical protein